MKLRTVARMPELCAQQIKYELYSLRNAFQPPMQRKEAAAM
jgi:hypothetical protein